MRPSDSNPSVWRGKADVELPTRGRIADACTQHQEAGYAILIHRSGQAELRWLCETCGSQWSGTKLTDVPDWRAIPVWKDERPPRPMCEVAGCRNLGYEEHHWLPTAWLHDDETGENWPISKLCREHHQEWHRRLRKVTS